MALVTWVAALLLLVAGAQAGGPPGGPPELRWENKGVMLAGDLLVPDGTGPWPAAVVIHGSGPSDRHQAWARQVADALRARGVAVLLPDKRGAGSSGGDWRTAGFEVLAEDAITAVGMLQRRPDVNAGAVGVVGLSQGGHVAPLAAVRSEAIAFAVALSASVVPIAEQARDELVKAARRQGLAAAVVQDLDELHRALERYALTGEGWDAYLSRLQTARRGPASEVAAGLPDTREHWVWAWARAVGDYDPLPRWTALRRPGLIVLGAQDTQIEVAKSLSLVERVIGGDSGKDISAIVAGGLGHGLRDPASGALQADLMDMVAAWIRRRGERQGR